MMLADRDSVKRRLSAGAARVPPAADRAVGEVTGHDTFHGLGRLDELGDGAGHALGVDGQVLLQIVGGLVDDLRPRGQTRSRPLRFPFSLFFLWCGICQVTLFALHAF